MLAKPCDQAFAAEIANNEPKLQGAESAPELNAVVHSVLHGALVAGFQIFRNERECVFQNSKIAAIQHRKVERREEPFVRIHDDGIRSLPSVEQVTLFRKYRGRASVRRI